MPLLTILRKITLQNISHVLTRFNRDPAYGFIDTKFSLITGEDFSINDPIRGKNTIFGWIQGRGLESLATHALWLQSDPVVANPALARQLLTATRTLVQNLETLRKNADGHLTFMMSPAGQPIGIADDGQAKPIHLQIQHNTLSDLFHVKALAAASVALNDPGLAALAHQRGQSIYADILAKKLYFDQQPFDPKNPVRQIPGRHILGPLMIGIYACSWLARATSNPAWNQNALTLIDKILVEHCHTGPQTLTRKPGDFWEFVDDNAQPRPENGVILSDPGHGIEVAGLALRHIIQSAGGPQSAHRNLSQSDQTRVLLLTQAFHQNFANGRAPSGNGLYKLINLDTRQPYNTQLPWWSLPEAMRAAAACALLAPALPEKQCALADLNHAFTAFTTNFIRPDLHNMAYQALDENAKPLNIVPATPDADPGYHTGLSLIDTIQYLTHANPA